MNDDKLRSAYQGLITRPASGRAGCPPPEALDALASRQGSEEARLATLNHAMTCLECRRELDLLRAVQGKAPTSNWRPRVFALAATLMLAAGALLVWNSVILDPADKLRGGATTPGLLEPGDGERVTASPRLVWRSVRDAVSYRVEVLDQAGAVVATGAGPDTTLQLPADALAPADPPYRWRVIAELRAGGSVSSDVRRLRVTRP